MNSDLIQLNVSNESAQIGESQNEDRGKTRRVTRSSGTSKSQQQQNKIEKTKNGSLLHDPLPGYQMIGQINPSQKRKTAATKTSEKKLKTVPANATISHDSPINIDQLKLLSLANQQLLSPTFPLTFSNKQSVINPLIILTSELIASNSLDLSSINPLLSKINHNFSAAPPMAIEEQDNEKNNFLDSLEKKSKNESDSNSINILHYVNNLLQKQQIEQLATASLMHLQDPSAVLLKKQSHLEVEALKKNKKPDESVKKQKKDAAALQNLNKQKQKAEEVAKQKQLQKEVSKNLQTISLDQLNAFANFNKNMKLPSLTNINIQMKTQEDEQTEKDENNLNNQDSQFQALVNYLQQQQKQNLELWKLQQQQQFQILKKQQETQQQQLTQNLQTLQESIQCVVDRQKELQEEDNDSDVNSEPMDSYQVLKKMKSNGNDNKSKVQPTVYQQSDNYKPKTVDYHTWPREDLIKELIKLKGMNTNLKKDLSRKNSVLSRLNKQTRQMNSFGQAFF